MCVCVSVVDAKNIGTWEGGTIKKGKWRGKVVAESDVARQRRTKKMTNEVKRRGDRHVKHHHQQDNITPVLFDRCWWLDRVWNWGNCYCNDCWPRISVVEEDNGSDDELWWPSQWAEEVAENERWNKTIEMATTPAVGDFNIFDRQTRWSCPTWGVNRRGSIRSRRKRDRTLDRDLKVTDWN